MPSINKIISYLNPKQFYKLKEKDLNPKTINLAIEKGVNLTEDSNDLFKYNVLFLKKYISKFGNTRFLDEIELIDFTRFSEYDINILLDSMYYNSRLGLIKTLNNYPRFLSMFDFKNNNLTRLEINELNDVFYDNYDFSEIPSEILKDNIVLIKKYLNNNKLIDIYKDLINYSLETKSEVLDTVINNIKNDNSLLDKLNKNDFDILFEYNDNFKESLLELYFNNNKDVTILKDYFNNDYNYTYYYLMQNIGEISKNNSVIYNLNNEQRINLFKEYIKLDNLDENVLYTILFITMDDEINDLLLECYLNNKIHNEELIIRLCNMYPIKMIESNKDNLFVVLKNNRLNLEEYKIIYDNYLTKLSKEELLSNKDSINQFYSNSLSDLDNMNVLINFDCLDLLNNNTGTKLLDFVKKNGQKYILKFLELSSIKDFVYYKEIMETLSKDNFDINTILPNIEYNYNIEEYGKDKVFDMLKQIKNNNIDCNIILIMNRVDRDLINEANSILPGKIRVAPLINQNTNDNSKPLDYEVKDILEKDHTLDLWVDSIMKNKDKDGNLKKLSPYEIVLACYRITTHFNKYTLGDHSDNSYSRSIYEFINNPNPEICCVGYSHLFIELLNRCGIETCTEWSVKASSESGIGDNHSRVMLYLEDPKYDIKGIYMCDPTWDSITTNDLSKSKDSYSHFMMDRETAEKDKFNFPDKDYLHFDNVYQYDKLNLPSNANYPLFMLNNHIPIDKLFTALSVLDMFVDRNYKMPETLEIGSDKGIPLEVYNNICAENDAENLIDEDNFNIGELFEKYTINEIINLNNNGSKLNKVRSSKALELIEKNIKSKFTKENNIRHIRFDCYHNTINVLVHLPVSVKKLNSNLFDEISKTYNCYCDASYSSVYLCFNNDKFNLDKKYNEFENDFMKFLNQIDQDFNNINYEDYLAENVESKAR